MNVFDTTDLCDRGWKLSESAVERKVKELLEVVAEGDEAHTTVVYHLFVNLTYACQVDGERPARPEKGGDGKYHVKGKLVIAGKEEMGRLVSLALPLLRAGGSCKKIVISPAARYKHGGCCSDRNHCTNILEKGYAKWMENALLETRSTIRD